tara:strand:- start:1353 stop:1892 length:540 start_codon:yes stop_codon:yes gene_type:complete
MTIKKRIRYLHKNGWSYKKISKLMNVSTSTLYNYRKNKVKNPRKLTHWYKNVYRPRIHYKTQLGDKTGYNFKSKTYIRTKGEIELKKTNYIDFELKLYNEVTKQNETRWYRYGMSSRNPNTLNREIQKIVKKIIQDYTQKTYHTTLLSVNLHEVKDYKYEDNKNFYALKKRIGKFNVKK